jgi:hypothetical protein
MSKEKRKINAACPQCGCSIIAYLTEEEVQKRYGDVPNIELTCSECLEMLEREKNK